MGANIFVVWEVRSYKLLLIMLKSDVVYTQKYLIIT